MRSLALLAGLFAIPLYAADKAPVDFTRDIRPILLNSCYACHGPDEKTRKGALRLDVRDEAVKKAIIVGKGKESPLVQRVTTKDRTEAMPPPASKKPTLTPAQVELMQRWIDEGAKYEQHWAYVKPMQPAVPTPKNARWVKNPIDAFVAVAHDKNGYAPSSEADRVTLARRLAFDLTGLPPTKDDLSLFLNDTTPAAYDKLVDRLLNAKHFGERMAVMWLDAVRYADTGGYHSDNHRDVWLFRDYVIQSFNDNKPFDRFTVEQLAGDLLPNPTNEQKIASGYNRMLMTTEEGGAQAKEYTAKYAADRVRNASNAWLGATLGCAECHNHKYDPYTTRDFYSFAAFFADVREVPVGRQPQTPISTPEQEAQLTQLDKELARLNGLIAAAPIKPEAQEAWEIATKKTPPKGLPKPVSDALAVEPAKRNAAQKKALADHYRTIAAETADLRKEISATTAKREAIKNAVPSTLISMTGPPRMIRVLPRGNWLDDSGEVVVPNVPSFLGNITKKERASRMDLAEWVVSADNPLTARVFVNRLWKITFGQGLVKNLDDFGTQGTLPSHPELLDWLSTEFIRSKWDVKAMLKLMVSSSTYRQSSVATKAMRERDPANIGLARQNRFRLDAEFIRDNALATAGLLTTKIGGPSSKPYQPAGYWSYLNFPRREWQADNNADQYRRGLYTYWCRSFLHPSLAAFDAPSREECTNERTRSSTPIQALVLLNDPTYVEAARVFAGTILRDGGADTTARLNFAFRQALARTPTPTEITVLTKLLNEHQASYKADPASTKALLSVGLAPAPNGVEQAELAAWTSLSRVLFNLHEMVTRN